MQIEKLGSLQKQTHENLFGGGPHNSESECVTRNQRNCYPRRRCRRFHCDTCMSERRIHFIRNGCSYIEDNKLLAFCTIAFEPFPGWLGQWEALFSNLELIWRKFYRHPSPRYIRCLSICSNGKPHIHLILSTLGAERISRIARSRVRDCSIVTEQVFDPEGLLGYLFDVNFEYAIRLADRPKRTRLLSASRGMRCGFPNS